MTMIIKSITSKSLIVRSLMKVEKKWLEANSRTFFSPCVNRLCQSQGSLVKSHRATEFRPSTTILQIHQCCRPISNQRSEIDGPMNILNFEEVCEDTLDSLAEYFEELLETCPHIKDYDVNHSEGILTVKFGADHGTYVINRQTPNQQVWLSSPTSGPKRYDFDRGQWVYRRDGITLHQLLDREVGNIVRHDVHFSRCAYSGTQHDPEQ